MGELSLQKDAAQIDKLQKQLRDLETQRESIGERARQASPHFAALHYPQPLDLEAARTALDPGTVLLSYSVSDAHTVLFVVLDGRTEPAKRRRPDRQIAKAVAGPGNSAGKHRRTSATSLPTFRRTALSPAVGLGGRAHRTRSRDRSVVLFGKRRSHRTVCRSRWEN